MIDHGPTSQSFVSQRLRLHYADWGNPDAPPLILLHGGRDHCRNWDWVAQDLRKDFHILAPDLRGHGDSGWSSSGDYSMSAFVYDLARDYPGQVPDDQHMTCKSCGRGYEYQAGQVVELEPADSRAAVVRDLLPSSSHRSAV